MGTDDTSRYEIGMRVLGTALRQRRTHAGWTIRELADRTGLSLDTIVSVETGRRLPSLRTLDVLALAYGTPAFELLRNVFPWSGGVPPDEPSDART